MRDLHGKSYFDTYAEAETYLCECQSDPRTRDEYATHVVLSKTVGFHIRYYVVETDNMQNMQRVTSAIESAPARSAWSRGVKEYALELLEDLANGHDEYSADKVLDPVRIATLENHLLNGAKDWKQYSWGGCALIYDPQIAERLCTPSELVRTDHGDKPPNANEEWLDVQARALYHAYIMIRRAVVALAESA